VKKLMTAAGLLFCLSAHADDSHWRTFLGLGVTFGGDALAKTQVTDRLTGETIAINLSAGGILGTFSVGAEYRFTPWVALRASGSLGRQGTSQYEKGTYDPDTQRYQGGHSYDGGLTFTTLSSEVTGFLSVTPALRIGLGARQSVGDLAGTGSLASLAGTGGYSAKPATVVELQYLFGTSMSMAEQARKSAWGVSLRAVQESFTHDGTLFNADHVGVGLIGYF
jgi:hypothetical protein